ESLERLAERLPIGRNFCGQPDRDDRPPREGRMGPSRWVRCSGVRPRGRRRDGTDHPSARMTAIAAHPDLGTGPPEIGQLVEVRGRHWVVSDSTPSALPPDVLAGESSRQHLLALSSVEDDALGEELRVVWE